jgi:hypothetical protein
MEGLSVGNLRHRKRTMGRKMQITEAHAPISKLSGMAWDLLIGICVMNFSIFLVFVYYIKYELKSSPGA